MSIGALPMIAFAFAGALAARAGEWSPAVEVRNDEERCVSYRARLDGPYLVVQATHEAGWHTYAMDNKRRADEKLAGRESLGAERPTEIKLTGGLTVEGPWYQSPPKDTSKPELNWFTWVFEGQALFAAKVRRAGATPARIGVRGQVCTESACRNIDITIPLPAAGAAAVASEVNLKDLVKVR